MVPPNPIIGGPVPPPPAPPPMGVAKTVDFQHSTHRGWTDIVYYPSIDRNALTPLLPSAMDMFQQLHCAAVGNISTDTARRAVRLQCSIQQPQQTNKKSTNDKANIRYKTRKYAGKHIR